MKENVKDEKGTKLAADLSGRKISKLERFGIFAIIIFVSFLLGFVPMWLAKRSAAIERDAAVMELRLSKLQNLLGGAMANARLGEYEPARVSVSSFFTDLRTETDLTENTALNSQQREALQPVLNERDEIITLLARSDPASAERLTNLYLAYTKVVNQSSAGASP